MLTIPPERLLIDRYGIIRIKEYILTIEGDAPVLITFDDALARIAAMPGVSPAERAVKIADRAVLERSMAKPMPYQGSDGPGNRILATAKQHAILHRALWVRDLSTVGADWSNRHYPRYITGEDLDRWPSLRDFLADPDTQYRDPRSERTGHVALGSIAMEDHLGWNPSVASGLDPEKRVNRQAIAARMEYVPWVEMPDEVELVLLSDEEAQKQFGMVPDGVIPVTNAAAWGLKILSRGGHPMALRNGDKLRGGNLLPFKGTLRRVRGKKPRIFLVEGGALKVAISENTPRRITVTRQQIIDGAFAVETPSMERVIRNPRFGIHMLNLLIGKVRAVDPEAAAALVPRMPEKLLRLASGTAEVMDYVDLCLYPVKGYPFDRKKTLDICRRILDGEVVVPINQGVITVSDGDEFYEFGITAAGRLLLRGVPPVFETVWNQLVPRISAEIVKTLRRRVRGVGGIAQGDDSLPIGKVRVSRRLARYLDSSEASILYWPSKQPHCLHRVSVEVDPHLDGSVIVVHPDILETLGGDSDGDLIYLITEPSIVSVSRPVTEVVTIRDRITGETTTYPNVIEMVRAESQAATVIIEEHRQALLQRHHTTVDGHERIAKVNESAGHIGVAFVARDLIMNAVGYHDDRTYVRMGMLCQEALDGLKVTTPVDIVEAIVHDPMILAEYLRMPSNALPFDGQGIPAWHRHGRVRSMYRALSDKGAALSQLVGAGKAASADAACLFEWILARTGIDKITLPEIITRSKLRAKADGLLQKTPANQVNTARYHMAKTRDMVVGEDVLMKDHRYGRLRHLLDSGVNPYALRTAVLDHVSHHPDAVEALGLLTALRGMATRPPATVETSVH